MTFPEIMTLLAGVVFAISASLYIRDMLQAKITPNIATFGVLTLVNFSQLIALIAKDVWSVVPFTTVGVLSSLIIFMIALKKRRYYFGIYDKIALIGALVGFVVWMVSQDAAYNLYIINAVTLITFIPLIIKAFQEPQLETKLPWQTNLLASTFLVFAITSPAPYAWIVPLRQFICSLLINIGLMRNKRTRNRMV